ncbi:MAG TPA: PIN domain-containing protein, partial [Terracidiphilus sp.]|nr:PIN domain-containing protein [Terracidiphilus sp.]
MILLDTNVLSELMRDVPAFAVVRWLDQQPRDSVWTTAINVFESRSGLLAMPVGKRRSVLIELFERMLVETIQGRVASFDR